ncbi:MAG: hypothetical protein ACXWCI_00875 [Caldimonas sp.]
MVVAAVDSACRVVYRPLELASQNDTMRITAVAAVSLFSLFALAACSTPSDIVKTGADSYRVRPDAGGGSPTDADIKARGIRLANEFCSAQGKHAVVTVGRASGWVVGMQRAEVSFYCDERPVSAKASTS